MTPTQRTDLTPAEAVRRFLATRETENTTKTVRSYRHRLAMFQQWANAHGLDTMADLDGDAVAAYHRHLKHRGDAPTTVKSKLSALKQVLEHCADADLVDDDLSAQVVLPNPSRAVATNGEVLTPAAAERQLTFYRDSVREYGTAQHVVLELCWHVGTRMCDLRALDLDDWSAEDRRLAFVDRPATPLKEGADSERTAVVSEPVADALEFWIERERQQKRDDDGRRPLLTTNRGRASESSLRCWAYQATQPCLAVACPHDRDRETCGYTERATSSRCPSSRSPQSIRSGGARWQLRAGLTLERVAKRADFRVETLQRYYWVDEDLPRHPEVPTIEAPDVLDGDADA